jgi:hypothetical protein
MLYPPFPATSEARSALPDAPVLPDRPPRRRLRLPVAHPLRWRWATRRATSLRLTGART